MIYLEMSYFSNYDSIVDTSITSNLSSSWPSTSSATTYALTILATETVTQMMPNPATTTAQNTRYLSPTFPKYSSRSADYSRAGGEKFPPTSRSGGYLSGNRPGRLV